jgi:hypothetical protein
MGGLSGLTGSPLFLSTLPQLTAHRGKLLSAQSERGTPVHAASFIRQREIVLETELLHMPRLRLILVHELFHFVWVRLGNSKRAAYTALLAEERKHRARGELGESAAVRKELDAGTRDYACESFCDTAAWIYAARCASAVGDLAPRWRKKRKQWFADNLAGELRC